MSFFGALLGANQQLRRDLRALDQALPRRSRSSPKADAKTPPATFARYRDADLGFELHYPMEWSLRTQGALHVGSERIGTFAHVEILPAGTDTWAHISREAGAILEELRAEGDRATGLLLTPKFRFRWDAQRFVRSRDQVILVTGNVIDSRRSRAIERYEDRVLAAIRRFFKVSDGRT